MVALALRFVLLAGGLIAISAALFLYEDEEGRVQNRLEEWWIKIDELQQRAVSRHTAFMATTATLATSALDRFFGKRLFSLRVIAISYAYSLASICLEWGATVFAPEWFATGPLRDVLGAGDAADVLGAVIAALVAVGAGSLAVFKPRTAALAMLLMMLVVFVAFVGAPDARTKAENLAVGGGLLGGVASDVALVTMSRWALRWGADLRSFPKIAGLTLFTVAVPSLFVVAPVVVGAALYRGRPASRLVGVFIGTAGLSNVFSTLPAVIFLLLVLALLAHRVLWPFLERPVYAASRYGVVRNKRLLWSVGVGLLVVTVPPLGSWLRKLF